MSQQRDNIIAQWALVGGGSVWGAALLRTLTVTLHLGPLYGWPGLALGAMGGALVGRLARRIVPPVAGWALLLPLVDLWGGDVPWRGPTLLLASAGLLLCLGWGFPRSRREGLLLAVLLPLAVYLPDLSPYVGRADTFEFQVVAPRLGIAHPSGYPLYILIGKLFSLLPLGTPAWRLNLSSAVFASLAAGALYLALTEDDPPPLRLALIPAFTLAFSPTLWPRAIEAEVYALNAFLVAATLWLGARFVAGKLPLSRALPGVGLLTGLGIASHLTLGALSFFALPLLPARPSRRTWGRALGWGVAGVLLYLYIPLRWPALTGSWMSLRQFVGFITNAESGGALHPLALVHDPARWSLVFRLLRAQVGWGGLLLALLGLGYVTPPRRDPPRLAFRLAMVLAFAAWVWFNLSFYVADPDYSSFLIPAHVVLLFWLGLGLIVVARALPPSWTPLLLVLSALLPLSRVWLTGPTLDTISQGRQDEAWGRYALAQPLADGGAILADSEKFPPLYYLQQVAGLRPDLDLVTAFSEAQYRQILGARLEAGQRVYLARYLPGLDVYGVSSVGPLVEVRPPAPPFTPTQVEAQVGPLQLARHSLERDPFGLPLHHLTLVWHVPAPITRDLEIHLRLLAPDGTTAWEARPTRPVAGYSATPSWHAGQTLADYHALRWPDWLPPGRYTLQVGVADRFASPDAWAELGTLQVRGRKLAPLPQRMSACYGGSVWLTGAELPGEVWAAAPLALDLAWWPPRAGTVQVRWRQASAVVLTATVDAPAWTRRRVRLTAPEAAGRYQLEIARLDADGQPLAARCSWLAAPADACPLGEITVGPSNAGLADFDDRIVLTAASLDAHDVPAGGQLAVHLTWRGLRPMEQDYTVFVQVLGADGQLYGQVDSWPVQGARPTHGWQVGETIRDDYRFFLHPDTPPGEYRVIVGWYLLADMHRLPLLDRQGRVVGDAYSLGTFVLP